MAPRPARCWCVTSDPQPGRELLPPPPRTAAPPQRAGSGRWSGWERTSIVAGGTETADGSTKGFVSRFDGSTWSPIGDEDDLDGTVYTLALRGDDLLIGGAFRDAGGVPAADYVALWDGAGWVALGSDGSGDGALDGAVTALMVVEDDVFASGALTPAAGGDEPAVMARWDGQAWEMLDMETGTQR